VFHVILDAAGGVAKEFVVLDDTVTAADKKASPVLTVWRRLWVEADSMGVSPQNIPGDDEAWQGVDIPDPPLDAVQAAMREAYVDVCRHPLHNEPNTTWEHNFADPAEGLQYVLGGGRWGAGFRQSGNEEAADFWVVYVVGVYELGRVGGIVGIGNDGDPVPDDGDNDPDQEVHSPGATSSDEPEASLIAIEQVRDEATQHHIDYNRDLSYTTAHEIGHQFELPHHNNLDAAGNPPDLMWAPREDIEAQEALTDRVPFRWSPEHIHRIRRIQFP
jgi:hypothetical protein